MTVLRSFRWLADRIRRLGSSGRDAALQSEESFWNGWLAKQDRPGFAFRMNAHAPLQPWIWCHLDSSQPVHRVLDVGCGPLSVVGRVVPAGRLDLTCCDPLAERYMTLLRHHGIEPVHAIDDVAGEDLSRRYGTASFDMAFSNNAVDHAADPLEVLRQMALVVRGDGTVLVQVGEHEGRHGGYRGLHQWDFREHDGRLRLASKTGEALDVTEALSPWLVQRSIERVDINPAGLRWEHTHLRIVWTRRVDS